MNEMQLLAVGLVLGVLAVIGLVMLLSGCFKANAQINQEALPQMARLPRYIGKPTRGDENDWAVSDID